MKPDQKLLIIEDDPIHQELYLDFLPDDSQLLFCDTALRAISLTRLITPDMIFVDLGLPDQDGIKAIAQLRQSLPGSRPAIIVVTGDTDPKRHQAAMDAGAQAVITKPMTEERLAEVMEQLAV